MENAEIADALDEIADLLEIQEANEFRVRSYRSAARTVRDSSERIEDMAAADEELSALPNIGERTAEKIHELINRGTCKRLEDLRSRASGQLPDLMRIPGLGPKKVKALHASLGIESRDDLKKASQDQQVRTVEGMGAKTEQQILQGIEEIEAHGERVGLREADEYAASLGRHLDEITGITHWRLAGSYRRRKETIGDIDVIVQAKDRTRVADALADHPSVENVVSKGTDKVRVRLRNGLAVDFLFFEKDAFGAALLYFTGSKAHNIALRKRARTHNWKLNEHGLFNGKERLAGTSEVDVYAKFGLSWIPPELREDRGELEAAEHDGLPQLIETNDIRGDLHAHTTASDGNHSIKEMAAAAQDRGYEYLAITDHSKAMRVANGLDEDRLRRHIDDIRDVGEQMSGFRLLAGVEVDILKDGALDLDASLLDDLDWVNASVHSHFDLNKKKMTERMLRAIRSNVIHCIAHPLGRQIGTRKPITLDIDAVLDACAETSVCLEINAYPDRLDLPDTHCQRARKAGVNIVISTDAHKVDDLNFMRYGVGIARRGWLEKHDVLNTVAASTLAKRIG